MLSDKLSGYLGFAARARKLQTGYNTVLGLIEKRKAKLVIIAEDSAEGTRDKITGKCRSHSVPCEVFGKSDELSHVTGTGTTTVFAVTDGDFAKVISGEIDRIRSEGEIR
ncbi:MAG: ribosomal L7Ae/L30e/S12e/Gadd45 family protein [Eubacterium sp.]|nr:ribosomal L7Ae/L30e/S12e/Gadd45 family protein [Eubacterium sp.]